MKIEKMRFVFAIILVAGIVFGSAVFYRQSTHKAIDEMTYDTLRSSAAEQSQVFRTALDGQYAVLQITAQLAGISADSSKESTVEWLKNVRNSNETHFAFIAIGDTSGKAIYHSGKEEAITSAGYKKALAGENCMELIDNAKFDGEPYIVLYVPVFSGNRVSRVILAGYDLDIFREMLSSEAYGGNSYSFFCDKSGNVIVNSFHANAIKGMGNVFTQLDAAEISEKSVEELRKEIEESGSGIVHYGYNGEKSYAAFVKMGINDWYMVSVVPAQYVNARGQSVTTSGWISLLVIAVIFAAAAVVLVLHERKLLAYEHASRVDLMMGQIKPHFMYNTLSAIIALIDVDPKRAKKMVMDFSKYMRNNIDVLSMDKMTPFKNELAHTRAYVSIEQVRFPNEITVEYDIQDENFLVPPLTVQPLVENAVKHGIHVKHGGTVRISTKRTAKAYLLVIADDGPGFDKKGKSKKPTGLDNVRFRLKKMCGGTLDISSVIGEGTVVTVTLPLSNRIKDAEQPG